MPRGAAVDVLHARQRGRRGHDNVVLLLGLAVLAVVGVVLYGQYEQYRARSDEDDFTSVCAIDHASIEFAVDAFVGDEGRPPASMDELVAWGLVTDPSPDWHVGPDPADPTRAVIFPDPLGRCV